MGKSNWMQTLGGKIFYPFDPDPEDIDITDIAAGLAKCCRWAGQCKGFFSVAQHAIYVSLCCSPENALWGLMHDFPEFCLRDLPKPIKLDLDDYNRLENIILTALAGKFELSLPIPDEVHEIDHLVCATESHYLMKPTPEIKKQFPRVIAELDIYPWEWQRAQAEFLMRFTRLITKREMDMKQIFTDKKIGKPWQK